MKRWHALSSAQAVEEQRVDPSQGLSAEEAAARLENHGPNELKESGKRSIIGMLWEQFSATMVVILIIAAIVSFFIGKTFEAFSILAIVVMFALLGFFQDFRAEKAMEALKKMSRPKVRLRRGGQIWELNSDVLVPGDIVLLENGNIVPADGRLIESVSLKVQEAALTGESESVEKHIRPLEDKDVGPGDRTNMVFMGTIVANGRATMVVTDTGMGTELGKIAAMLSAVKPEPTPLQKKLDQAGKLLAGIGGVVALAIAAMGLIRGESWSDMFLLAISIAVAVIPEGLPAVVTITLAIGARRMLQRKALIRRLPAVETLGSVTHICSDKTGTLTQNIMSVQTIFTPGAGPCSVSEISADDIGSHLLLLVGTLCNDAELVVDAETGTAVALGDPTEGALVIAAYNFGIAPESLKNTLTREGEFAFDSDRKRMSTVHLVSDDARRRFAELRLPRLSEATHLACVKGSLDGIIAHVSHVLVDSEIKPIDATLSAALVRANEDMAGKGMRVLAAAIRPLDAQQATALSTPETLENELTLVGLYGLIDPPRPEVIEAIAVCRLAGIRPFMITGDHPLTAQAIATDLRLSTSRTAITGVDLQDMSHDDLTSSLDSTSVFARVSPEHKIRIVEALQKMGGVVAMTGDGVNDAPALKKADIGVAMGITGTDVSKEASDMVLQDDNFATIVAAVEEGRVIYDNIRKFIKYSIAGNLGKIITISLAPLLALALTRMFSDLPIAPFAVTLLPLQLLWINLLTDGLLGVGLGVEPAERGVMKRPPVSPKAGIFSGGITGQIFRMGTVIGLLSLLVGLGGWYLGYENWQTMMFTSLAFAQIWQAIGTRSVHDSIFTTGLFTNPTMAALLVLTTLLQLSTVYVPFMRQFLGTLSLGIAELLICVGATSVVLLFTEIEKVLWKSPVETVGTRPHHKLH
jgi:Ca2+-transporting ATPase